MTLPWLEPGRPWFPPAHTALTDPNGLLAFGGALSPDWLIRAYQHGIFPWYESGQPILWWTPDPRMVLFPEEFRLSRSMKKFIRRHQFRLSMDESFAPVIAACGETRASSTGTWITAELKAAYVNLHRLGIAHSVEVWAGNELAGGLYGVALGQVFFGESMFSKNPNCSKLALAFLVNQLRKWDYKLIDCQVATQHLASLGAREIPRREFLGLLDRLVNGAQEPATWPGTQPEDLETKWVDEL